MRVLVGEWEIVVYGERIDREVMIVNMRYEK